eukprot:9098110-Pyramimonas_sp.AAC.1
MTEAHQHIRLHLQPQERDGGSGGAYQGGGGATAGCGAPRGGDGCAVAQASGGHGESRARRSTARFDA